MEESTTECAESAEEERPRHAGTGRIDEALQRQGLGGDVPHVAKTGKISEVSALAAVSY